MSNVRKKVKVTVIGALVAALASCGGGGNGDSEANKVEQVAKDYYSAFARGDAKTACDLQEQESEAERAGCEAGVKYGQELGQEVGGKLQETLTHVDIKNVRVSGDTATATADFPGTNEDDKLEFAKRSGEWKLTSTGD